MRSQRRVERWIEEALKEFGPTDAPSLVLHVQQNYCVSEEAIGESIWTLIDAGAISVGDELLLEWNRSK